MNSNSRKRKLLFQKMRNKVFRSSKVLSSDEEVTTTKLFKNPSYNQERMENSEGSRSSSQAILNVAPTDKSKSRKRKKVNKKLDNEISSEDVSSGEEDTPTKLFKNQNYQNQANFDAASVYTSSSNSYISSEEDHEAELLLSDEEVDSYDTNTETAVTETVTAHVDGGIETEKDKIRQWAVEMGVRQNSIEKLLKVLRPSNPALPTTAKTLLKDSSKEPWKIIQFDEEDVNDKSELVYFGITDNLKKQVNPGIHGEKTLYLQFNIDGLPLYKSGSAQFWPILGKVFFNPDVYEPFVVSIYSGNEKPHSLSRYLKEFVEEVNDLLTNGIFVDGVFFSVKIMAFICDRPARSYIKGIIGHNGYHGCERCEIKGMRIEKRMAFPSTNDRKRTDKSFRKKRNIAHHKENSPLLNIKPCINMVKDFPLDSMHLTFLGVMKKLLNEAWLNTTFNTKLSKNDILRISQRMANLSFQIPDEFQRRGTQSLGLISKWKATEFRFFLLYCGPLVLKDVLPSKLYEHFLLLYVALRILSNEDFCKKYLSHSRLYLKKFVLLSAKLYSLKFLVLNLHSLLHLTDDVEYFQCSLSKITAFPFENLLGKIKKLLRSGNKPLAQFCRRKKEQNSFIKHEKAAIPAELEILKSNKDYDSIITIHHLKYLGYTCKPKKPNNCFMLKNNTFILIEKITSVNELITLHGNKVKLNGSIFMKPTKSADLNIFAVKKIGKTPITVPLHEISCKALFLSVFDVQEEEKVSYILPLLHC